jgi:hypothetical protein
MLRCHPNKEKEDVEEKQLEEERQVESMGDCDELDESSNLLLSVVADSI